MFTGFISYSEMPVWQFRLDFKVNQHYPVCFFISHAVIVPSYLLDYILQL